MSKKNHIEKIFKSFFTFLLVSIIVVLAFSVLLFKKIGGNNSAKNNHTGEKEAPISLKQPPIELPKVLYNLSGKITKMEKDAVTFDATISSKSPKGEIVSSIESRKANIGSATNIKKLVFIKNSPVESEIKISDLKIGDYIEVISGQDISVSKEFTATLVRVLP